MRLPDWSTRLDALVRQAHRTAFAWGVRDCCLWAADAALAVTGIDHAADVRGTYQDEPGALAVLQRLGGLVGVADRGGPRIAVSRVLDGDVGLVRWAGKPCLGVRIADVWLLSSREGLCAAPGDSAVWAWGIGHA